MKKFFTFISIVAVAMSAYAAEFTTAGDGTEWTFSKLSQTEESGVTAGDAVGIFVLDGTVTIAAGDSFVMEDGITVMMTKGAEFDVLGEASFDVASGATFTRSAEGIVPKFIFLQASGDVNFKNIHFEYAGLKLFSENAVNINQCTFRYHEASVANGGGALNLGGSGAVKVTNSTFEYNKRSGVAGAANSSCDVTIEDSRFFYNDQQNVNYPQINLTAGDEIIIRRNTVIGDRTKTRGGGIVVSNLMGAAQNGHAWIEYNYVSDNRFGISVYSDQRAYVRYNTLINNNTETTPANGGSGINVTDANAKQVTTITGNHIEGHYWGISILGGKEINVGNVDVEVTDESYNPGMNVFVNNQTGGVHYDLYNNTNTKIYAQNNYWKDAVEGDLELGDLIYDVAKDEKLGEVVYLPAIGVAAPQSLDLNNDASVNVGDVSVLYDAILGGAPDEDVTDTPND